MGKRVHETSPIYANELETPRAQTHPPNCSETRQHVLTGFAKSSNHGSNWQLLERGAELGEERGVTSNSGGGAGEQDLGLGIHLAGLEPAGGGEDKAGGLERVGGLGTEQKRRDEVINTRQGLGNTPEIMAIC
nr:unnamed protein product [Digitaria exilis]